MTIGELEQAAENKAMLNPMRRGAATDETVKVISLPRFGNSRAPHNYFTYYINGNKTTREAASSFLRSENPR